MLEKKNNLRKLQIHFERFSGMQPLDLETIASKIYIIRGRQVILDYDLARMYGVETKYLKRQVRRNIERFPEDFMFELTKEEQESLRRHFGTLKRGSHPKYLSFAFTEQGVASLSGILRSKQAVAVYIQIMRTFVNLRHMLYDNQELWRKIEAIESRYDSQISHLFKILNQLLIQEEKPKRNIGF